MKNVKQAANQGPPCKWGCVQPLKPLPRDSAPLTTHVPGQLSWQKLQTYHLAQSGSYLCKPSWIWVHCDCDPSALSLHAEQLFLFQAAGFTYYQTTRAALFWVALLSFWDIKTPRTRHVLHCPQSKPASRMPTSETWICICQLKSEKARESFLKLRPCFRRKTEGEWPWVEKKGIMESRGQGSCSR